MGGTKGEWMVGRGIDERKGGPSIQAIFLFRDNPVFCSLSTQAPLPLSFFFIEKKGCSGFLYLDFTGGRGL